MNAYAIAILAAVYPVEVPSEAAWPVVRAAVLAEARRAEVLDEREENWLLKKRDDFPADVGILRGRVLDLADAPPLADHRRFPPRPVINEWLATNRRFRKYLADRLELEQDRREILLRAINECDELYRVWDWVRDSQCEWYYTATRRRALKSLRDHLGDEAYRNLDLPPPWPSWRLRDEP